MCILEGVFSGNLSLDMSEESTWRIRRYGFCGMRSKKVHFSVLVRHRGTNLVTSVNAYPISAMLSPVMVKYLRGSF